MLKNWMIALLLIQGAEAELTLAPLFQDGAVLQRDRPVPVWGRAEAGAEVKVTFAEQTQAAVADDTGRWQVALDPLPANSSEERLIVTAAGGETIEVAGILVGEVWLASGQSNMEWKIEHSRPEDQAEAAKGPVPLLRLFQVSRTVSHVRQESLQGSWETATPETVLDFSAVGYFFGKHLVEKLGVPVGIIHSSWGGSRIEPWWAEEGLEGIPELAQVREERLAKSPGFPGYDVPLRRHLGQVRDWLEVAEEALESGHGAPLMPAGPELLALGSNAQTGTYQAMIHPLVPYGLRGFIWYQGESNNGEGLLYTAKKQALIDGWRKQFAAPEAPFLFVQLAPYNYGADRNFDLPGIWKAQQETLKIPYTGMAVTHDIGDVRDIHPRNKSEVGRRLALWALADTYGQTDLVKSGPLFAEFEITEDGIVIRFDHAGSGLTTRDGQAPDWFEIAGSDGEFKPAQAVIADDLKSILLTHSDVPQPDRARFAWSQLAEPNLMNREGLPAAAFHTHWPTDPTLGKKVSQGKPHASSHPNAFGWDSGLTDGIWGQEAGSCYATDASGGFPKTVTLDLGSVQPVHAVVYGVPTIGATKTVAVAVSEDGQVFQEVGRHEFPPKQAVRTEARFDPRPVRFVRATFIDHHPKQDNFDETFGFLSELEAYAP